MVSPPSVKTNSSQEIYKGQSSKSFKHGYANLPSSTESNEFKPLVKRTPMESMVSKKISDSQSTVFEECVH